MSSVRFNVSAPIVSCEEIASKFPCPSATYVHDVYNERMRIFAFATIFALCALAPVGALAASATKPVLEVSGWIPYWRTATGTADALAHLDALTEINPFGYIVQKDGTLHDALHIGEEPWVSLIRAAKAKKVRVVPTVMWSDTDAIHDILRRAKPRRALEDSIANLVKEQKFDGIDIDFEAKKAETRDYFSLFLKGLYLRMGNKWVMCSIESRTPVSSRYDGEPPKDATVYANDYVAINKYCDRVRIMAYDQGAIDVKLNAAQATAPYVPVADPQWVEKVVALAAKTISKKKIMIGVPTYGYEYEVTPLSERGYRYSLQWALNPGYALALATDLGISPARNSAGELSFMYTPTTTPISASGTPLRNIVWWSDARAIEDKITLARKLGVRGISIFKLDGGEDPALWNALPIK